MNEEKHNNIKKYSKVNIENIVKSFIKTNRNNLKFIQIIEKENKENINYLELLQTEIFKEAKNRVSKFKTKIFINNGEKIYVSNGDIKESIAKTLRNKKQKSLLKEHLLIFENIDKIIENGNLISKAIEYKGRYGYSNWNYYVTLIKLNDEDYIVEFDTTLRNDGQRHFRLERIYSLKEVTKKQVVPTEAFNYYK